MEKYKVKNHEQLSLKYSLMLLPLLLQGNFCAAAAKALLSISAFQHLSQSAKALNRQVERENELLRLLQKWLCSKAIFCSILLQFSASAPKIYGC